MNGKEKAMNRRIISLVILLCLIFVSLISCSDRTEPDTDTGKASEPDSTPADTADAGQIADYGGEAFTIAEFTSTLKDGTEYYCGEWIDSDDLTGEAINDAVYKRNVLCERAFNVDLEMWLMGEDYSDFEQLYLMGDTSFDAIYGWASQFAAGATEGTLADLGKLDSEGYLDLSKECWDPAVTDSLAVNGKTYLAANDASMSWREWAGFVFYNPDIVKEFGLEDPASLVDNNEWTVDKFCEMVASVQEDLDGYSGISYKDLYGLIDVGSAAALYSGAGMRYTDDNGRLAIGSEKSLDLISKIVAMAKDGEHVKNYDDFTVSNKNNPWGAVRSYFASGHSLFLVAGLGTTEDLDGMESGYGIVPLPKYDSSQEGYCSAIDRNAAVFCIPSFVRNDVTSAGYERTGQILEFLAERSRGNEDSVYEAFFASLAENNAYDNETNRSMIELALGGARFEWTNVYGIGTVNGDDSLSVAGVLSEMMSGSGNANSVYKRSATRLQSAIDDFYDEISSAGN